MIGNTKSNYSLKLIFEFEYQVKFIHSIELKIFAFASYHLYRYHNFHSFPITVQNSPNC